MRDLIETNLDRLYGYAYSLTQDGDQARDLVQDCALRALEAKSRPTVAAAYRAWLFRILRNAFIDRCRRNGREVRIEDAQDAEEPAGGWQGDQRLVDVITIRIALARLSLAHREIIALVDFVGCSYAETAEVLDIPEGTVMSRLARARRALLDMLAADNIAPLVQTAQARGRRGR